MPSKRELEKQLSRLTGKPLAQIHREYRTYTRTVGRRDRISESRFLQDEIASVRRAQLTRERSRPALPEHIERPVALRPNHRFHQAVAGGDMPTLPRQSPFTPINAPPHGGHQRTRNSQQDTAKRIRARSISATLPRGISEDPRPLQRHKPEDRLRAGTPWEGVWGNLTLGKSD